MEYQARVANEILGLNAVMQYPFHLLYPYILFAPWGRLDTRYCVDRKKGQVFQRVIMAFGDDKRTYRRSLGE